MRYTSLFIAMLSCFSMSTYASTVDWDSLVSNGNGYGWIANQNFNESQDHILNFTWDPKQRIFREHLNDNLGYMRGSALALLFTGTSAFDGAPAGIHQVNIDVGSDKNGTLHINMNENPNAGILLFQRSMNSSDSKHVPLAMNINGNVDIHGNVNHKTVQHAGIHSTGIAVNSSALVVNGDVNIKLKNLQGSVLDSDKIPPKRIQIKRNLIRWHQFYGWTNFDALWKWSVDVLPQSSLLMTGITQGYSNVQLNGNVSIDLSGQGGFLAGWYFAPNPSKQHTSVRFGNLNFRQRAIVKGSLKVTVDNKQQGDAYGVNGIVLIGNDMFSQNGFQNPKLTVNASTRINLNLGNQTINKIQFDQPSEGLSKLNGTVHGLYIDNALYDAQSTTIDIDLQGTKVSKVKGVHAYLTPAGKYQFKQLTMHIDANETAQVNSVYGLYVMTSLNHETETILTNANINLHVKNPESDSTLYGVYHRLQPKSFITMTGDTSIKVKNDGVGRAYAIYNRANTVKIVGDGVVQVEGDIYSRVGSPIEAHFIQNGSYLKGAVLTESGYDTNLVTLNFGSQTYWDVTGDSYVQDLTMQPGSTVNIARHNLGEPVEGPVSAYGSYALEVQNFASVNRQSLSADASVPVIHMDVLHDMDLTKQESGLLVVHNVDSTANALDLLVYSQAGELGDRSRTLIIDSQAEHTLDLMLTDATPVGRFVEQGAYLYRLDSHVDIDGTIADALIYEDYHVEQGDKYYFLRNTGKTGPTADNVVAMATHGAALTQYLTRLTDYRQRMSQVGQDGNYGAWVSLKSTKDRIRGISGAGFRAENTLMTFGWDTRYKDWIVGLGVHYGESDQETRHSTQMNGRADSYGMSFYATYRPMNDSMYVDIIGSWDRFDTDLDGVMADGISRISGNFKRNAWGLSVEGGHKFEWNQYYIEPSVQAAYYQVRGEDFRMNDTMIVRQDHLNSLTVRAGVATGYQWKDVNQKVYADVYAKVGIKHRLLGDQKVYVNSAEYEGDILGTRTYYGIGGNWKVTKNIALWGSVERELGQDYTQEYQVNLGARYMF